MKLIEKTVQEEYQFEIKEGILIVRAKEIENGKYYIRVTYKPTENYGTEFYLCGMEMESKSENIIKYCADISYESNDAIICDIIKDIHNEHLKCDSSDVKHLIDLV